MHKQVIDIGLSKGDIEKYLKEIGYWDTPEKRERHAYILSPGAYVLHPSQHKELQEIARAVYSAVQELERKLIRHHKDKSISNENARFLKIARKASQGLLKPGEDTDDRVPPIIKIDLVQSCEGGYKIVEVDSYNPRALGTMALVEGILSLTERKPAYSLVKNLSAILNASGKKAEWKIIISERERYYETSFSVLSNALSSYGVRTSLVREKDIAQDDRLLSFCDGVSHVFIIPDSINRYPKMRQYLLTAYQSRKLNVFYPPKSYLGSKAYLPFLEAEKSMAGFIPPTFLVARANNKKSPNNFKNNGMVLKPTSSSGGKGVIFADSNPDLFASIIKKNINTNVPQWII